MKVTIYDVAEKAGVSISTVSKVINHQPVGQKSKEKVQQAMAALDYRPSVVASALTGKRTSTIGVLLPDIANPFLAEVIRQVEDRADEAGYHLVICSTDFKPEKEAKSVSLLQQKSVDGFIMIGDFRNSDVLKELVQKELPVVFLAAESPPFVAVNTVTVDNFIAGYEIGAHLVSLGHKNIAFIAEQADSSRERIRGLQQSLADHGVSFRGDAVKMSDSSALHAAKLTEELLAAEHPPSAVVSSNDVLAMGVMIAARERGLSLPGELSITGCDNTLLARASSPSLTTVSQPVADMCARAVELLVAEIEGMKTEKQKILVRPSLIVRESTGKPAGGKA